MPFCHHQVTVLFYSFPALLSIQKSDVQWTTPPDFSCSIGWLARCTAPHPLSCPHTLLLRLVFTFTLVQDKTSPTAPIFPDSYTSRCSMWNGGVYWFMEDRGAECMVELVQADQSNTWSVIVVTKGRKEESCVLALNKVVELFMSSLLESFESSELQFFLLDSTKESDLLSKDNHFSINEIEQYLSDSQWAKVLTSQTGRQVMQPSKLKALTKDALWYSLFSLDRATVLHYLEDVSSDLLDLGLHLKLRPSTLGAIRTDFRFDCDGQREQVVKKWMSSTHPPPCWWHLTEALRKIGMGGLAKKIFQEQSKLVY